MRRPASGREKAGATIPPRAPRCASRSRHPASETEWARQAREAAALLLRASARDVGSARNSCRRPQARERGAPSRSWSPIGSFAATPRCSRIMPPPFSCCRRRREGNVMAPTLESDGELERRLIFRGRKWWRRQDHRHALRQYRPGIVGVREDIWRDRKRQRAFWQHGQCKPAQTFVGAAVGAQDSGKVHREHQVPIRQESRLDGERRGEPMQALGKRQTRAAHAVERRSRPCRARPRASELPRRASTGPPARAGLWAGKSRPRASRPILAGKFRRGSQALRRSVPT